MEPSNLSLETPRATIPDIYVGFSPSFSTHFLTSSNIALPYPQDSFPLSPTLQYRSNLFDYYGTRFNLSSPSSPTSPLFSSLFHKVKKGRHRLTVEEFNARFAGKPISHTRLTKNVSKLKKTLHYFGTIGRPIAAAPRASSLPCTPIRNVDSLSSDVSFDRFIATPMRLQYRLKQMCKKRPILIQSPLRQSTRAMKRDRLRCRIERKRLHAAFNENGTVSVPSLPNASGSLSFSTEKEDEEKEKEEKEKENAQKRKEVIEERREEALELVGGVRDGKLTGSEEVMLDLKEIKILLKEVTREQLQNVRVWMGNEG